MKIALVGATGFVGSKVLAEALSRGHQVIALQRDPNKLAPKAGLEVRRADVYAATEVAAAVAGADAVVSAFNPGWSDPQIRSNHLRGSLAITAGVKQAGVRRFLMVGGAGSLFVAPDVQLVDTPQFPAEWKEGALGAREALNQLRTETTLEWTFLSPPAILEPGQRSGKYREGGEYLLMDGDHPARIAVEDLAVAIVDTLEQGRHIRERFTVAN